MGRVEVMNRAVAIPRENRNRGILLALTIFASQIVLERLSPALNRRSRFQPRVRACARNAAGSAAATIAKSTFWAIWWATPLKPSIQAVHIGHGLV